MPKIDQTVVVKVGQLENEPLPFLCLGVQVAKGQYAVMQNPEFQLVQLGEKIPDEAFFKITFDDLKDLHRRIGEVLGNTVVLAEENPAQQEKVEEEEEGPDPTQTLEDRVAFLEKCVGQLMSPNMNPYEEIVNIAKSEPEPVDYYDPAYPPLALTKEEEEVRQIAEEVKAQYKEFIEYAEGQLAGDKKAGAKARSMSLTLRENLKVFREKSIALDKSRA